MIFKRLQEDIRAFMVRDPAAKSRLEVFFCYPGLHAILFYRLSSMLWRNRWFLLGRFISHIGRMLTSIEIHPGAKIGRRFVIDHGTGVVVGETSVIGDDVTLYHGVTLGGIAPAVDSASQVDIKRHPTLENHVIVGSGAQILGNITIGEGARVGSNAVVTHDVPAGTTAVGIPARVVMPQDKNKPKQFEAYGQPIDGCPDPVLRTIEDLRNQVAQLQDRVAELDALKDEKAEEKSVDEKTSAVTGRS
jgi:serine O-acetyltransferase